MLEDMDSDAIDWAFDVSSFMVLVGESEEYRYRAMRRSITECFAAAPIAGIQSYLHSTASLAEATGRSYFSPVGMNSAPLRNMQLEHAINLKSLLADGSCAIYEIPQSRKPAQERFQLPSLAILSWVLFTWIALAGILAGLVLSSGLTWIGYANVFGFVGWSILARLIDRFCMEKVVNNTSDPDRDDAVFILGRRNSCLILKGKRRDLVEWTGHGIRQKPGRLAKAAEYFMRTTSLIVILFIFLTIPNGTTWDQVAFIGVNITGQLNVLLGQRLTANHYFSKLTLVKSVSVPTRTHVYGVLLREFGDGKWVDDAGILPRTDVWDEWRSLVTTHDYRGMDSKKLYEECLAVSIKGSV
ncbi:hypothetical protein DRE_00428 [Drechslerella stenobrocha 248]|uniref:Uncharacterized protein n=1 Tax=Drechslerella stenobrocha 248 TaxID=1043628 RepID=W7IEP8_9PEZI|nr:hypothetical protein DRE_00428 [Drechslerella stenobrocha 248]